MEGNKLTDFNFVSFPKIKKIVVSNNEIRRVDIKESFKNLLELDLSGNQISDLNRVSD